MRAAVWKFYLPTADRATVQLPLGTKVLSVGQQDDVLYLWGLVPEPELATRIENRVFLVAGTGHVRSDLGDSPVFIGTVMTAGGRFVWHVFEEPR